MKSITLNNGVIMPQFGLGTFKVEAGESAYQTVKTALKLGYRHIDTAIMYHNEEDIGRAINDSGIKREEIFVTTKILKLYNGDKALIKKDLEASLERLNIGYVDLILIHWPNYDYQINLSAYQVLEEMYSDKKYRAIGVSNFQIHHLDHLIKNAKVKPMVNQVELHPLLSQVGMQKYLKENNIALTSYGPFAKAKIFESPVKEQLEEVAKYYGATITQVIIAWGLQRGIIMIPKSVHEERLLENLEATKLVLTNEDMEKVSKINRGTRVYTDPDNNAFN